MSEQDSTVATFRLMAYHEYWVAPLVRQLGTARGAMEIGAAEFRLATTLYLESINWIEIGQELGYFGHASELVQSLTEISRALADWDAGFDPRTSPSMLGDDEVDNDEFEMALFEAMEDLTPERREFLHVFHFSEEREWRQRLEEVSHFAQTLLRRPGTIFAQEYVDRVAWALEGAEPDLTDRPFPAHWRSRTFPTPPPAVGHWFGEGRRNGHLDSRIRELWDVRGELQESATWIAEDDRTSAQLRIADALRRGYNSDRSAFVDEGSL